MDDPGGGGSGAGQVVEGDVDQGHVGIAADGVRNLIIETIDPILRTNRLQSLLSATDVSFLGGRSFTLDTSLERVFGGGATRLAIEFDGMPNMESVHNISDSSSTDSAPFSASSTPGRGVVTKKRWSGVDAGFGDLSGISLRGGFSSGEESDGEFKKPRLGLDSDQGTSDEEFSEEEENVKDGEVGSHLVGGSVLTQGLPGVDPEFSPGVAPEQVSDLENQQDHGGGSR